MVNNGYKTGIFLDSYQFLYASLDALMKDYVKQKEPSEMTILNQSDLAKDENGIFSPFLRDFLLRKGLIPWKIISGRRALKDAEAEADLTA